ncbi:MAG: biotin/lipoyl-binding protein, partial [Cyanobacteria bacterium P01_H01_bin.121]
MATNLVQQPDQQLDHQHQNPRPDPRPDQQQGRKSWQRRVAIAAVVLALGGTGVLVWPRLQQRTDSDPAVPVSTVPVQPTVTALGYLEPDGEVIAVSATTSAEGSRVQELLVQEGDWVEAGQAIAILDSRDRLEAGLSEAQEQVRVAEANLARVLAGSQTGEITAQEANVARVQMERQTAIQAQKATITRLKLELANAEQDVQRYDMLFEEGAISDVDRDQRQLTRDVVAEQLEEAEAQLAQTQTTLAAQIDAERATLDRIAEVRPVDVAVAEAEVRQAKAAVQRAETDLAQTIIRAPKAGRILDIYTRPGEAVASEGIVAIGQTDQ